MTVRTIEIKNLTRVEGYGGITVNLDGKRVSGVKMEILEGTRFYEAIMRGKHYMQAATIVSRVCAICSASHAVAAQMAVEDAFGIPITDRTRTLRDLLLQGENIESHALHLFLLVMPDYLGYSSALDMAKDFGDEARMGLFLKRLGNHIQEVVGGRAIHPPNVMVGRFGRIPSRESLEGLLEGIDRALSMVPAMLELFRSVKVPPILSEPTTYIALRPDAGFGFVSRTIAVSDGSTYPAERFPEVCNERVVSHSHAKQSLYSDRPFAVGAQSRLVLGAHSLTDGALDAYESLRTAQGEFGVGNPLYNSLAQVVELVYSLETARCHLKVLLEGGLQDAEPEPEIVHRGGAGIGILEAPRGILYHRYVFDDAGTITDADIITPTAQNLANIERDMRLAVERLGPSIEKTGGLPSGMGPIADKDLAFLLQVIARSYDPCISCSVH